jgi:hypothetical protein
MYVPKCNNNFRGVKTYILNLKTKGHLIVDQKIKY